MLPRAYPFDDYDEFNFRERFRLAKAAVASPHQFSGTQSHSPFAPPNRPTIPYFLIPNAIITRPLAFSGTNPIPKKITALCRNFC